MTRRKKTSECYSRQVHTSIHNDERCALSKPQPNGQTLFIHLLTCPITTQLPGVLMRTDKAGLAEELGWSVEDFLEKFAELEEQGMAVADWKHRLVFLPNGIKVAARQGLGPDWVRTFKAPFRVVPECDLKVQIWERFHEVISQLASDKPLVHGKTLSAFREAMKHPGWTH